MNILPTPEVSAWDEPEMPAKTIDTSTLAWARPPFQWPTRSQMHSISLSVMPPSFIRLAASMNSGTASSVKLFRPLNILVNTTMFGMEGRHAMPVKDTRPSAKAMGVPMATSTTNMTTRIAPNIMPGPPS